MRISLRKLLPGNKSVFSPLRLVLVLICLLVQAACTTTTIDEYVRGETVLEGGKSLVVMGRRHSGDYETEPWIVSCIGKKVGTGANALNIIGEYEFQDQLYPWFEPRNAPTSLARLQKMLAQPLLAEKVAQLGLKYIVWIDGSTQRGESKGGVSCAATIGAAGCFGFGTWEDDATYEVAVWDIEKTVPVAELNAQAAGTSYMPAVVLPVPLVARVKSSVCSGLAEQIRNMFVS